jgi:putative transcriptional regulator
MLIILYIMFININKSIFGKGLKMLKNCMKELRARHGFSQTELAKRVGVTRQTIGFIEKGEFSPSIALSLRLAKHLQLRVDELFWLEGENIDE